MTILITILHVIVCFVLIMVILLQAGRGQGLTGGTFGSGNVQSLFGTKASVFLTKATSVSAICFMLTCIALDLIEVHKSKSLLETSRSAAPVDVDQIKKALEKIKNESREKAGAAADAAQNAAAQAGEAVKAQSAEVKDAAAQAGAAVQEAAVDVKQQVQQAAGSAANAAQAALPGAEAKS